MYVDVLVLLYGMIWMGKYCGGRCCDCIVWLRYDVAWYNKVWCTEVDGMVQYGVVHCSVWCNMNGMVLFGTVRYGTVRYGTGTVPGAVRYSTVRTVRYVMVGYDKVEYVWFAYICIFPTLVIT
jgi:hypothetical protein